MGGPTSLGQGGVTVAGAAGLDGGGLSGSAGALGGAGGTGGTNVGISTDPWPSGCVNPFTAAVPLSPESILSEGPVEFGAPPMPGEEITATVNGVSLSFSNGFYELFNDTSNALLFGYGDHGELGISAFPLAPGTYSCPAAALAYGGLTGGSTSDRCCRIDVTKVGDVGDTIEGTFSGILAQTSGYHWVNVENGRFKVVRRAPTVDGGTARDASSSD